MPILPTPAELKAKAAGTPAPDLPTPSALRTRASYTAEAASPSVFNWSGSQEVDVERPFSINPIADNAEAAKTVISKIFPTAPAIVEGVRTGNWEPYKEALAKSGVDMARLSDPDPEVHGPEIDKLGTYVLGVGAEAENVALGVRKLFSSIAAEKDAGKIAETLVKHGFDRNTSEGAAPFLARITDERDVASAIDTLHAFKKAQIPTPDDLRTRSQAATDGAGQAELPKPTEVSSPASPELPAAPQAAGDAVRPQTPEQIATHYWDEVLAKTPDQKPVVIGGDDMKDYFGRDYAPERSPAYSKASYQVMEKALQESPKRDVVFLGGGPGAGKTEIIGKQLQKEGFDGILYDSSFSSKPGIEKLIRMAEENGKDVHVYGVLPNLETARMHTILREARTGRDVPDQIFANRHAAFPRVLRELIDEGKIDQANVHLYDLRAGELPSAPVADPLATLKQVSYNEDYVRQAYSRQSFDAAGQRGNARSEVPRRDAPVQSESPQRLQEARRTEAKGEVAGRYPTNLISSIARAEDPAAIADTLANEFPGVTKLAVARFAKALSGIKRTGDIEAMLDILNRVDANIRAGKPYAAPKGGTQPGMPDSVARLMNDEERSASTYLDSLNQYLSRLAAADPEKASEAAIVAQREYEMLWDSVSQKTIDRHAELLVTRDVMRDVLETHPGKKVLGLYKGSFLSPQDYTVSQLLESTKGRNIPASRADSYITEFGYPSMEDAQRGMEDYQAMVQQYEELKKELRDIAPQAKAARLVRTMIEDVPVLEQARAGEIDALANPEQVRKYADISGFMGQARDLYRNFQAVFGEAYPAVKRAILDPFDRSKGDMVNEIRTLGDRLEENIVSKLGIMRGSEESAAVQKFGEGRMSIEELTHKFGDKADGIQEAVGWFRSEYDRLIDELNAVYRDIYPNNPKKLIPKRKDYFRHFQEMGGDWQEIKNLFDTPSGIDPRLAGISEFTKPKTKFLSLAQERIGKETSDDAVGGFIDYVPQFAYAKHVDQHIGAFRYLRRQLSENAPRPGVREVVDIKMKDVPEDLMPLYRDAKKYQNVAEFVNGVRGTENAASLKSDKALADFYENTFIHNQRAQAGATTLEKQQGVNNFLGFLDDFANDLAGKTNPLDRYLQKIVPGGRTTMRVVQWLNARVKANTILGNLSSSVAQIFNVPQGVASAKTYSLQGARRTLGSIFAGNEPMEASSFIRERYAEPIQNRFKIRWVDDPTRRTKEDAKQFAAWLTGALDEVGTKFIWNAHYEKAVAEGMADPVKFADDVTRRMVAGRGVGEVPLLQKSKVFQLVAPFQLEVGNAWYVLDEFYRRKDLGAIATMLVASYLMNRAAEAVRGSPVVFDPIQATIDGATQATDEMRDGGSPTRAAAKFLGREAGEVLSNIPLGQTVAAAVSDDFIKNHLNMEGKKELFGSADPGRFGSGLIVLSGVSDPLYKLIPPFGGAQLKKTMQGIVSMVDGEVRGANGKLSFRQDGGVVSLAQAFLFGKNATASAHDAYATRDDLFQRVYSQTAQRNDTGMQAEAEWKKAKDIAQSQGKSAAVAHLQQVSQEDPALGDAIKQVAKDEALGLNANERLIGMLGVENGERAKYIAEQLGKLKTRDDKAAYLQNLSDKKLISATVKDQLQYLMSKRSDTNAPN